MTAAVVASGAEMVTNKGRVDGYTGLDNTGLVPTSQLPAVFGVASYMGVEVNGLTVPSSSFTSVAFANITAQLGSTSISWDKVIRRTSAYYKPVYIRLQ